MEEKRLLYLYQQFIERIASSEELVEFDEYLSGSKANDELSRLLDVEYAKEGTAFTDISEESKLKVLQRLTDRFDTRVKQVILWPRIAGIAAAVAAIVFGVWLYSGHHLDNGKDMLNYAGDIAPGKQGATLTLANGKKIRLTEQAQGQLAEEAGVQISKTADGQLTYEIKGGNAESNKINTLSTAKGETYIVTLPDKSKVWLNAASSLTYPASLNERGLRRVRLEGEAYFEVAKDKKRPFVVESRNQVVTVLGTHFNINSYRNERAVKTTLLEGSVKVNPVTGYGNIMRHVEQVLKPGQQSSLDGKHVIEVAEADPDEALAWKDGFFRFNGEDVRSIMRKLSRWYDIEVVYEGNVSAEVYYGKVSRSKNISAVLKVLEKSQGVHFKIEGRRVTVLE